MARCSCVCVLTDDKKAKDEKTSDVFTVDPWCESFGKESRRHVYGTDDELALWEKALPIINERTRNDWNRYGSSL